MQKSPKAEKPATIDQYKRWLQAVHHIEVSSRTATHYESVTNRIKRDFEKSDFWIELGKTLKPANDNYQIKTGYRLFASPMLPEIDIKTFDSFLLKTFRRNVLENRNWPNQPHNGWILPNNWITEINDVIRTSFVVKYLDGVEFLIEHIRTRCESCTLPIKVYFEAREEGYYAVHSYIFKEFEVPKIDWDSERITVKIEVQITTELQDVIRKLLHKYYAARRIKEESADSKWQWDYNSEEFGTNYLGHILHYVEGMIMDIREKQKKEKTG